MKQNETDWWNTKRVRAAQLLAEGQQTDEQIAADLGIGRATLHRWKLEPIFQARVTTITEEMAAALKKKGIRSRENRLRNLQIRVDKMLNLIDARGQVLGAEIAGGETGLLVKDYRAQGEPVYKFDAALLRELREHEKQAAVELGEWSEKQETLNIDLSQLTDEQLDRFEQHLAAGESTQRAYARARKA